MVLAAWLSSCEGLRVALKHGQQTRYPNIHLCILDLLEMLTELNIIAVRNIDAEDDDNDITL